MRAVAAAILVLTMTAGQAMAGALPAGGMTIDEVEAWLQGKGYSTGIVKDSDGSKHVSASAGNTTFGVYMYDCDKTRCGSVQFAEGFATHGHFDTKHMNDWNRTKRWARGYFDSVNDPWVEMDVDLTPGGTYELLNDEFGIWLKTLGNFKNQYGLK
jgi:hypothetical protein